MGKRMSFKTHFCKDFLPKKICEDKIDKRIRKLGFLLYAENLNFVFFHQYSTSNTFVLKIFAEMSLK